MISMHQPRVPQIINLFFIIRKVCLRNVDFIRDMYYNVS